MDLCGVILVGSDDPHHSGLWPQPENPTRYILRHNLTHFISCLSGKLVGGFCALSGVFILTLPIPIVVNSFAMYYKNRLWRTEVNAKKRERTRQQAAEMKEMQKFLLIKVNFTGNCRNTVLKLFLQPSIFREVEFFKLLCFVNKLFRILDWLWYEMTKPSNLAWTWRTFRSIGDDKICKYKMKAFYKEITSFHVVSSEW